jgi:hypothetical protein
MFKACQARGFSTVACRVGGNKVVDGVVGVARPRQEMINGAPSAKTPRAVEAILALRLGQGPTDALEADPLGAEQELIQPFRVYEVGVAGRDPGSPFRLDSRLPSPPEDSIPAPSGSCAKVRKPRPIRPIRSGNPPVLVAFRPSLVLSSSAERSVPYWAVTRLIGSECNRTHTACMVAP